MAVLLVNQHTVPIFIDIANAFADSGEETILFTGHIEKGGQPLSSRVKVIKSKAYQRRSSFSRLFSWMFFSAHYFFYLLFCKRPSCVLVVTNPPLAPFVTYLISKWRKLYYSILLYDLYPDALAQAGLVRNGHFIYTWWQKWNYKMFKKAHRTFTLSESMKEAVRIYLPNNSEKIKVIYNWADSDYIKPIARSSNAFIRLHKLDDKRIVMYSGNMGLTHDLESLIEAADLLKSNRELVFVLIGDGGKRQKLEQMSQSKNLPNVLFLPYQNSDQFPLAMAAADISVVTLGVGAEGISVPSKTYISLAAGACLLAIAPASSELSRLVEVHQVGRICEPGNPRQVAEILHHLFEEGQLPNYRQNALKASRLYTRKNANEYIRELVDKPL